MTGAAPRIVLYGVGQYGQHMVRFADDKGWPIVAALNRAGGKVGQDIGTLAGLGKDIGVQVEDCDQADYGAITGDVALVMTASNLMADNLPAYRRLLGAGLNVICHSGDAYYPRASGEAVQDELDSLARDNGVSFLGTGVWDMSRIWSALLLAGPCNRINSLFNRSLTNTASFGRDIAIGCGAGMSEDEFAEKVAARGTNFGNGYLVAPPLVLEGLGYTPAEHSHRIEPVVLDDSYVNDDLGLDLKAGSCAGMRSVVEASSVEGVTVTAHIETRVLSAGEVEHTMWSIDGDPLSPSVTIERDDGSVMSAMSVFNRITDVIAAEPGVRLITDLPPMRHLATQ